MFGRSGKAGNLQIIILRRSHLPDARTTSGPSPLASCVVLLFSFHSQQWILINSAASIRDRSGTGVLFRVRRRIRRESSFHLPCSRDSKSICNGSELGYPCFLLLVESLPPLRGEWQVGQPYQCTERHRRDALNRGFWLGCPYISLPTFKASPVPPTLQHYYRYLATHPTHRDAL